MTPDDYRSAVDRAEIAAGPADDCWNRRFRDALAAQRLRLAPTGSPDALGPSYPDGYAYRAPPPFHLGDARWLPGTLIVWMPELLLDEARHEARQERSRDERDPRDRYG